ncbi:hypothetical protein EDD18DRAFT_1175173 [Armillaria luteobubalina]|uniref:Uncharacterized protein n=1 Tax=Armillaria luteobubalina TaxID=153913 RepID=A0AA39ULR3_9AGAR|nr:hypothetical protein EDD18DRAFT_1175173 [Armillaria luteobubalina]
MRQSWAPYSDGAVFRRLAVVSEVEIGLGARHKGYKAGFVGKIDLWIGLQYYSAHFAVVPALLIAGFEPFFVLFLLSTRSVLEPKVAFAHAERLGWRDNGKNFSQASGAGVWSWRAEDTLDCMDGEADGLPRRRVCEEGCRQARALSEECSGCCL